MPISCKSDGSSGTVVCPTHPVWKQQSVQSTLWVLPTTVSCDKTVVCATHPVWKQQAVQRTLCGHRSLRNPPCVETVDVATNPVWKQQSVQPTLCEKYIQLRSERLEVFENWLLVVILLHLQSNITGSLAVTWYMSVMMMSLSWAERYIMVDRIDGSFQP